MAPYFPYLPSTTVDKIQIIGIGDDGLEGLTAAARQLIRKAELILGAKATLAAVGKSAAEKVEVGRRPGRDHSPHRGREREADRAAHHRRSAVLRHCPLPLRPAGQGPVRGRAARQQHAARLRPREGELGRRLPHQPRQPAARAVVEKVRTAEKVGLFTTEADSAEPVAQALLDRADRLLHRLRLREPRLARRARHAGGAGRSRRAGVRAAQRDDPGPQAGRARPPERRWLGRRLFGNPDEAFLQSQPKRGLLTPAEVRGDRPGGDGHRPDEHRLGHRRRQRLGRHRGRADRRRRQGLRDRNGPGGPRR